MRFGVYLPTFAWRDLRLDQAARVKDFARKAEALGFAALWVAEHFLEAPGLYGTVWMSPLLCLAHAASVTTRIRLATGLLIAPYYHPVPLAREKPYVAPAVLARIAGADGWLARAAGNQQMVKDDVRAIRDYCVKVGRDPNSLRYGHLNFVHLVDTPDREEALRLQRPIFERVMGTHRTFENLQQSYFLGTTREIVERVRDLEAAGVQDMVLATCDDDLTQLERFASEIAAAVSSS